MKIELENINLIRKIAWSFHNTTKVDYEELFSEAALEYFSSLKSYSPEKGLFTTWAYHQMYGHLLNVVRKHKKFVTVDLTPYINEKVCYQPTPFSELMETLTEDGKQVVELLFSLIDTLPDEYTNRKVRVEVKKRLQEEGWTDYRIYREFRNLRLIANEI